MVELFVLFECCNEVCCIVEDVFVYNWDVCLLCCYLDMVGVDVLLLI